ncbi:MAG: hypothetical protein V4550_15805 [Gemmatimonadota bacterium]
MPSLRILAPLPLAVGMLLSGTSLRAQGFEYAMGTSRYKITMNTKATQTSPFGNADFDVEMRQFVTVDLNKRTRDTVTANMVLDSIAVQMTTGVPSDMSELNGAKFTTLMSPTGRFYSSRSGTRMDPMMEQFTDGVVRLVPSVRSNLANGASWSDTTTGKVTMQGMQMDRTTVSSYKVTGDTVVAGQKAFRIRRTTTSSASGGGNMQANSLNVDLVSSGTGTFFVTARGSYLGGTSTDDVTTKVTMMPQNMQMGVKQTVQTRVEPIK